MARVCIICTKEAQRGQKVEDDFVIRIIRRAKQQLRIAKNNELVVCEGCMEAYRKRREGYEKNLVMHVVLAAVVLIIFAVLPIFTTGFSLPALLLGVALAGMIVALSVFSHCPKIASGGVKQEVVHPQPRVVEAKPNAAKAAAKKKAKKR